MQALRGFTTVLGRVSLTTIFFLSAVGNKIPNFSQIANVMGAVGMPAPQLMLVGAIVFLIAGSLSVIVGFRARIGAGLLLTFLVLATYFFHAFWNPALRAAEQQAQMIQFMKNLSMMGAMLFIIANGSGPWSVDGLLQRRHTTSADFDEVRADVDALYAESIRSRRVKV
jgi:putative oxidoreductase